MSEITCEPERSCNVDQQSFKALLARWMAATVQLIPSTYGQLMPKLRASAQAAALQCSGPNKACGLKWTQGADYDGVTGVGEQMSAMEVFQVQLIKQVRPPVTNATGGTSKGNIDAGIEHKPNASATLTMNHPITISDKARAAVATACVSVLIVCGAFVIAL